MVSSDKPRSKKFKCFKAFVLYRGGKVAHKKRFKSFSEASEYLQSLHAIAILDGSFESMVIEASKEECRI